MTFNAFGDRQANRFRMFATAVAGERALTVAAGLPPGHLRQWTRNYAFKESLLEDAKSDMIRLLQDSFQDQTSELAKRSAQRFAFTWLELHRIASDIGKQTVRQATFGLRDPLSALDTKRLGTGAIGQLAQRRLADPAFKVRDNSGREWDAETLVRTIARDFAYQTQIDSRFQKAIDDSQDEVTLQHPDDSHIFNGVAFKLDDAWLTRRDQMFHVNSELNIHASV